MIDFNNDNCKEAISDSLEAKGKIVKKIILNFNERNV